MSDAKTARRLDALTNWARWAAAGGHTVPSDDELACIAADPDHWRDHTESPATAAWAHTIAHVLLQLKCGVSPDYIVDTLSDELTRPDGPVQTPQSTPPQAGIADDSADEEAHAAGEADSSQEQALQALIAWRQTRMLDQADGADQIKLATLRRILALGYTDSETIGKLLPGRAAYLGGEIADVVSRFSGSGEANTPDTDPAPGRPSVDPRQPGPEPQPAQHPSQNAAAQSVTRQPVSRTPDPAETAPRPVREPAGLLALTHNDFCEYQYQRPAEGDAPAAAPGPIRVTPINGGRRLSFDPFVPDSGKMVIYRVVAADGSYPRKPEAGDLVGVTTGLSVEDMLGFRAAVRTYQVWCHVGVDQEDAVRNNPHLLARGHQVSPVSEFEIHISEGRISGEWTAFPGASRVRVDRVPMDGTAGSDHRQYEICRGEPNLEGFADWAAEPGRRYLYKAYAEVSVDGVKQLSDPLEEEVSVPVSLTAVEDLALTPNGVDLARIDMTWTAPPIGRVRLYWASARPRADLGQQRDLTKSALQIVEGFREENRIKGPTDKLEGGKARMAGVTWPQDWPRVYITPVTELGEQVRVGATRVETRQLPAVNNAEIVERYDTEMVTFGWPSEAASVLVYVGSTTAAVEEIIERNSPVEEIWRTKYERDGGITFDRRLEEKGCTVVLVPVNYSQREAVQGQPTALSYPGLHRIRYDLAKLTGDPTRYLAELHLTNSLDIDSPITLTMVNRLDRLPLSATDGDLVYFVPRGGGEHSPQFYIPELKKGPRWATGWCVDLTRPRGYFRLFISSQADPTRKYALSDPPIADLYLDPTILAPGTAQ